MVQILKTIGVLEAKSRLSEICSEIAKSGDTVVISNRGEPLVEVRPIRQPGQAGDGPGSEGILDCLRTCRQRFGPLEEEFEIPRWSPEFRFNDRDPFADYWTDPAEN
ncbi:MAG: antitoxin (DNA-binding transcriptional repressor) of toxin-antitoxin stability system [Verrucomicrobiales bacterium]|jgi:antitoxin (DNA-binding transcriptional repressor) of toxin-antitoxin stability system